MHVSQLHSGALSAAQAPPGTFEEPIGSDPAARSGESEQSAGAQAQSADRPSRSWRPTRIGFSELRCFAGCLRLTAALIVVGLSKGHFGSQAWLSLGLAAYVAWAAWRLWCESRPVRGSAVLDPWIDLAWIGMVMMLQPSALGPAIGLALTAPVALGTIMLGWRHGLALTAAALGLVALQGSLHWGEVTWLRQAMRFEVLALLLALPLASWSTLPMKRERERQALLLRLAASVDPRRGLSHLARQVIAQLRSRTDASLSVWVQTNLSHHAAGYVSSATEGEFLLDETRMGPLLDGLNSFVKSPMLLSPSGAWWADGRPVATDAQSVLARMSVTLEAKQLVAIPLAYRGMQRCWLLLGGADRTWALRTLRIVAPLQAEILLLAEQAMLADALQEETAAHEKARIGRDLQDSAVQPYLGLKYAVEALALRTPPDNPVYADLQGLSTLAAGELAQLRETISTVRGGTGTRGDDALVPALNRQLQRFTQIFGIEAELHAPEGLRTSRTLARALFHMVNEALNNVRKHTEATRIQVRISHQGNCIQLSVRDNAARLKGAPLPDFVPASLAERARDLGGTVGVHRPDGINTEVVVTVPGEGALDLSGAA